MGTRVVAGREASVSYFSHSNELLTEHLPGVILNDLRTFYENDLKHFSM